jgi:hypothetical protein
MIEKYFLQGVRFIWTKPNDDTKGTMDGSVILSDPKLATPEMLYDGLDGELINPSLTNVTQLGFKKGMKIPYQWLTYAPGRTSKRLLSGGDCLTGYMSGCLITLWKDEKGLRWIGHVGTVTDNDKINKLVKNTFGSSLLPDTTPKPTGFNPLADWPQSELIALQKKFKKPPEFKIFGLVTGEGNFFSIAMFKFAASGSGPGNWCCAGIKPAKIIKFDDLKKTLMA